MDMAYCTDRDISLFAHLLPACSAAAAACANMLKLPELFSTAAMKGAIDDTACTVAATTSASLSDAVCCSSFNKARVHLQQHQLEDDYSHKLTRGALMGNMCTAVISIRVQVREEAKEAEALQCVPQSTICYVAITHWLCCWGDVCPCFLLCSTE